MKKIVAVLLAIWVISVLKCEVLTLFYGNEFREAYKEVTYFESLDRMRVLKLTPEKAKVYYITDNNEAGIVINFSKNGEWVYENWDVVWSESGSADSCIWPYGR